MREDKHRRKHRQREQRTGADLISKEAIQFDGCETFNTYNMPMREWKARNSDETSAAALFRADPFGVNDYFVDYSLNKKKRWTISEEIRDRIEEVQDARRQIRVSASVHGIDRSELSNSFHECPRERLPCLEYHSVSRDGKTVTHKQSEYGRTRLRNFTHAPQPQRRTGVAPIREVSNRGRGARGGRGAVRGGRGGRGRVVDWNAGRGYRTSQYHEQYDWTDRSLAVEEKQEYQKLHVHYTIQAHSDRPSLHNKAAASPRKQSKERRPTKHASKPIVEIPEVDYEDEVIVVSPIEDEAFSVPTVVEDLSDLVVVRKEKKRGRVGGKREPLRRFVDELLKTSLFVSTPGTSGYGSEDDYTFDDEEPSTSFTTSSGPSPLVVSLPTEMFTRVPLTDLPNLAAAARMPCFPPAWEVHQRETLRVLCRYLLTCVVARQYGDELRLAVVEDCASTHPSRPQLPPSDDVPPDVVTVEEYCEICYGEMDLESQDRLAHPFALSCAHVFCTGCWLSHVSECINRQRLPAACLHPDCTCTLSVSAAKGLLASSSVDVYELATIDALKAAEKLTTCPECKRLHYSKGSLHIACPCGASLCGHCSSVDHSPLGCDVFDQYNSYMKRSGFASVYSTNSEAPIIRNLCKCPKCNALMQRSEGCNHMTCACGMEFCYRCGLKWTSNHYSCTKEEFTRMTMIDVFTARQSPLLIPSLLTLAIESRTVLIERRKELRKRLLPLPFLERKAVERAFVQLSLIVELCCLSFRRSRRARHLADRIRFWLDDFYNTADKNIASKARALQLQRDTLSI